jgi:hypothetical protein
MRPLLASGITLTQVTTAFAPFGILLCGALLYPELTQTLDLGRTKATILAASALLIPALALYPFAGWSQRAANLGHLFWTFAYLTFLVHAWWAVFVIFHGIGDTFVEMGTTIAGMNFLLVIWWGLEVVLSWIARPDSRAFALFQLATHIFVFLVFALTLLFLRPTVLARLLGIALVAATLFALAIGYWATSRRSDPQSAGSDNGSDLRNATSN